MRPMILAIIALSGLSQAALADPLPTVVEMFTSQGCSSCPPAEAVLGELTQRADVVTLAYHVDYWNYLGWKDPFSLPQAALRQRTYAKIMALDTIYTPQMIINGTTDVVGSDRQQVMAKMKTHPQGLAVKMTRNGTMIAIETGLISGNPNAQVTALAVRPRAVTPIARGENSGRTVTEYSIVTGLYELGPCETAAKSLDLSTLPTGTEDVVVLIQNYGVGPILGVGRIRLGAAPVNSL